MDPSSSQTALGFEDRIRQMLSGDRPSVRLPPASNLAQQPPATMPAREPAGVPSWDNHNAAGPSPHQVNTLSPDHRTSGLHTPAEQLDPPHHRPQANRVVQQQQTYPPRGVGGYASNQMSRGSQTHGHNPPGQRTAPQHPKGPFQHMGQRQRAFPGSSYYGPAPPSQQQSLDPDAFSRGGGGRGPSRPTLFDPNARPKQAAFTSWDDTRQRQAQYLQQTVEAHVSDFDMPQAECDEKDAFRLTLQDLCHQVCEKNPDLPKVKLECFGSFASGFASAGSDMDLVIVVQDQQSSPAVFSLLQDDLPRTLEDALLRAGFGARLLTRTRVPIIKVCQSPNTSFLDKLRQEREKWDFLPDEKKYPHLFKDDEGHADDDPSQIDSHAEPRQQTALVVETPHDTAPLATVSSSTVSVQQEPAVPSVPQSQNITETTVTTQDSRQQPDQQRHEQTKTWTRERKAGPLDFPKEGVGIQCDINFFNPLGIHNTHMLRCYSLCDTRVRPIVLFVKAWAKLRGINSSYSGTLSSYGFVMMVLHYLMNIAQPPVIPNLQMRWRPSALCTPHGASKTTVDEWVVDFWRNEDEINMARQHGQLSSNRESIGSLLAGFFQYYSSTGSGPQFQWMRQVLSLRTTGGIMTKEEKGWVKAVTEEAEGKKIQHRYLFCIEDPFELTHNVARTVTHNGIVAIRDEFRRAQRILYAIGRGQGPRDGQLFQKLIEAEDLVKATAQLKVNPETLPIEPAKQRHEQRRVKQPSHAQGPDGTTHQPQRQQKKQLDMTDQAAFPTLGVAPTKKPANAPKEDGAVAPMKKANFRGGRGRGNKSSNQIQAHAVVENSQSAEAQGEQTANSAVQFLGL